MTYGARYGHQPLSELKALTRPELERFVRMLQDIIRGENGDG